MCLFGVFRSSLQGKKETLQFRSLKSSFIESHVCNSIQMSRSRNIVTSSHFWKPSRRAPRPVPELSCSPPAHRCRRASTGRPACSPRLPQAPAAVPEGGGTLWHLTNKPDECKYLFVNHLFHSVSSRSAIRLSHAG